MLTGMVLGMLKEGAVGEIHSPRRDATQTRTSWWVAKCVAALPDGRQFDVDRSSPHERVAKRNQQALQNWIFVCEQLPGVRILGAAQESSPYFDARPSTFYRTGAKQTGSAGR